EFQERSAKLGALLLRELRSTGLPGIAAVRGRGLWAGIDLEDGMPTGRRFSELLLDEGVLAKDTHGQTIRLAPPLVVTADDLEFLMTALRLALDRAWTEPA